MLGKWGCSLYWATSPRPRQPACTLDFLNHKPTFEFNLIAEGLKPPPSPRWNAAVWFSSIGLPGETKTAPEFCFAVTDELQKLFEFPIELNWGWGWGLRLRFIGLFCLFGLSVYLSMHSQTGQWDSDWFYMSMCSLTGQWDSVRTIVVHGSSVRLAPIP